MLKPHVRGLDERTSYGSYSGPMKGICVKTEDSMMLLGCCEAQKKANHRTANGSNERTGIKTNHRSEVHIAGKEHMDFSRGGLWSITFCGHIFPSLTLHTQSRLFHWGSLRFAFALGKNEGVPTLHWDSSPQLSAPVKIPRWKGVLTQWPSQ